MQTICNQILSCLVLVIILDERTTTTRTVKIRAAERIKCGGLKREARRVRRVAARGSAGRSLSRSAGRTECPADVSDALSGTCLRFSDAMKSPAICPPIHVSFHPPTTLSSRQCAGRIKEAQAPRSSAAGRMLLSRSLLQVGECGRGKSDGTQGCVRC